MMRSRDGMTLLEMVISLVITGLMAGIGAAAFTGIIDERATIVSASKSTERAGALRESIHGWLVAGSVMTQQGGGPRGGRAAASTMRTVTPGGTATQQSVTPAVVSGDVLQFTTNAPNPAGSATATIRMFIDDDANTTETGLTIEYQANAQSPLMRRQLDASMDSLHVEFLDSRTNRWFASTQAATISPKAVRVTFHSADSTVSHILALPMLLPVGTQAQGGAGR